MIDVNLDFFLRQIKPPDVQEKYMIGEKETTEHGVTLVDAPLLLDEGFGLEEVSLTTLLELAELKPNADNLVNLDCDGDKNSSLGLPIITT
jgi:hypothetical protein